MPPQVAAKILALDVPGINAVREYKRYYPAGPVMGHVMGFTNIDNKGQEGVELAYNESLKGQAGRTHVLRDKVGHIVEYVDSISCLPISSSRCEEAQSEFCVIGGAKC